MDCDITEIPGADNLFQTEGIIQETQEKYRELYDVRKSYLLINGTSGGLIAAVLAAVEPGDELILARNCHKSVCRWEISNRCMLIPRRKSAMVSPVW